MAFAGGIEMADVSPPTDFDRELAQRALPHLSAFDQRLVCSSYGLHGQDIIEQDALAAALDIAPAELGWRQMSALLVADSERRRTHCPV